MIKSQFKLIMAFAVVVPLAAVQNSEHIVWILSIDAFIFSVLICESVMVRDEPLTKNLGVCC